MSKESKKAGIELIGGSLDGITIPTTNYFREGDIEAVNTLSLAAPENGWSAESVYVLTNGRLVYDPVGTRKRAMITAADPSQLE